jgi:hypothetical protein
MPFSREIQGDPTLFQPCVGELAATTSFRPGARAPQAIAALMTVVLTAPSAAADDTIPAQPEPALRYTGDLDGDYVILGPIGGAVQIEDAWDGAFGAGLGWLRVRERRALSAAGATLSASRYSERDGGRLALEVVAGTRRIPGLGGVLVGISAGPALELGTVQHPRAGVTGAAWLFAGVVPYVRAGTFDEAGAFVEVGLALALPVARW